MQGDTCPAWCELADHQDHGDFTYHMRKLAGTGTDGFLLTIETTGQDSYLLLAWAGDNGQCSYEQYSPAEAVREASKLARARADQALIDGFRRGVQYLRGAS